MKTKEGGEIMNIYYNPEKFGLRLVGQVEWTGAPGEHDQTVIWSADEIIRFYYADEIIRFYYTDDAGGSCPAPFEDKGVDALTKASKKEVIRHLQGTLEARGITEGPIPLEVANLIARINDFGKKKDPV
jgi:hypothetical protein